MPKTTPRSRPRRHRYLWIPLALLALFESDPAPASASAEFAPTPRQVHATIHSIGIEWDLVGDDDHDAVGQVRFRRVGDASWRRGLPLIRIDYHYPDELDGYGRTHIGDEPQTWNMLAGSLFFLQPATDYEVQIRLRDPDGGAAGFETVVRTRVEPQIPSGAPLHVAPGDGGGSGSEADPFRGIAAAEAAARPGDIFVLHTGDYGAAAFTAAGAPRSPVVWRSAIGEAAPLFSSIELYAAHVWFFGLAVVDSFDDGRAGFRPRVDGLTDVAIRGCRFTEFNYSIRLDETQLDWTILDNVIVGDNDPDQSDFSGEGIELDHSSGHAVGYNSISRTADGVSYPLRNCDIYGNDIFDTSDDGLEPDYGYANNRMWGNRIRRALNNGLSFQPQFGGPWYFLYNQVVMEADSENVFKFNGLTDRNVAIHNTFVQRGPEIAFRANSMTSFLSRNNLYVATGEPLLRASFFGQSDTLPDYGFYDVDWRTNLDRDGFAWTPGVDRVFDWLGVSYPGVAEWAAALGIEASAIEVPLADLGDLSRDVLTLAPQSVAVDAGVRLPNVQPFVTDGAPDLGAHEVGGSEPHHGPRVP